MQSDMQQAVLTARLAVAAFFYGRVAVSKTDGSRKRYKRKLRAVLCEVGGLASSFACSGPRQFVSTLSEILDTSDTHGWKEPVAKFGEKVLDCLLRKPRGGVAILPVLVPSVWEEPGE